MWESRTPCNAAESQITTTVGSECLRCSSPPAVAAAKTAQPPAPAKAGTVLEAAPKGAEDPKARTVVEEQVEAAKPAVAEKPKVMVPHKAAAAAKK